MIKPSESRAYSPYFLQGFSADNFWRIEAEITSSLRDYQGGTLEFDLSRAGHDTAISLSHWLHDHGWSALYDQARGKLVVWAGKTYETR